MVIRREQGLFFGNPYGCNSIQPGRAGFDNIFRRRSRLNSELRDGVPAGALVDITDFHGGYVP